MEENCADCATIARLNDELRTRACGGRIMFTRGVYNLPSFDASAILRALAAYERFSDEDDPFGERDFGVVEVCDAKLMWKIDYYDLDLKFGSPDPANPEVTVRVLTVFLPSEY